VYRIGRQPGQQPLRLGKISLSDLIEQQDYVPVRGWWSWSVLSVAVGALAGLARFKRLRAAPLWLTRRAPVSRLIRGKHCGRCLDDQGKDGGIPRRFRRSHNVGGEVATSGHLVGVLGCGTADDCPVDSAAVSGDCLLPHVEPHRRP